MDQLHVKLMIRVWCCSLAVKALGAGFPCRAIYPSMYPERKTQILTFKWSAFLCVHVSSFCAVCPSTSHGSLENPSGPLRRRDNARRHLPGEESGYRINGDHFELRHHREQDEHVEIKQSLIESAGLCLCFLTCRPTLPPPHAAFHGLVWDAFSIHRKHN